MAQQPTGITQRKTDHLDLVIDRQTELEPNATLLSEVRLVHQALPESSWEEIDLTTTIAGRELAAPVMIAGMTGGTDRAGEINRDLATVAAELGIGFGVGSQRVMAEQPELAASFKVREVAPELFLIGNLGVVQARQLGPARVAELFRQIEADAMAIHLNPAMELIQKNGDRDFTGAIATIAELVELVDAPIIVKETGCGLSREACRELRRVGVETVDVSGAGGTSWVAVERRRATAGSRAEHLGAELSEWGIPTAVSIAMAVAEGLEVIGSGGLRSGVDVARAVALGATAGGLAAPVLRAHHHSGRDGARELLERVIDQLRAVTLLSGCRRVTALAGAPRHLGAELRGWFDDLGLR